MNFPLNIPPTTKVAIINDEPDNRFLELGATANADFLITGNIRHFNFKEYGLMKIVTHEQYIHKHFVEG